MADMWDRIAWCESGQRWHLNLGSGYYGGLQFNMDAWRIAAGFDFAPRPDLASREEQITAANRLLREARPQALDLPHRGLTSPRRPGRTRDAPSVDSAYGQRLMPTPFLAHETWTTTRNHVVHAYASDPSADQQPPAAPLVVILPGLGLPQYMFPTAEALSRRGVLCTVLDLPGFAAAGRHGSLPDVHDIGRVAAEWVEAQAVTRPVVVLGHSTGSQAALAAA
jgi:acetyl esterase/lipase